MKNLSYYQILGVASNATSREIRRAFFEAARKLHPDINPHPDAQEQFIAVQKAYETLSSRKKRAAYDASCPLGGYSLPKVKTPFESRLLFSAAGISRLSEPQLFYALLEIRPNLTLPREKECALNICLVIDRSTSMKGERMDMVKANVSAFIKKLSPTDLLSVVAFGDRAEVIVPATPVSQLGDKADRISLLSNEGATEIYHGLERGLFELQKASTSGVIDHLILITDGHTYGDESLALALARKAAEEGVVISALGIGSEWNDEFLDRLSGLTGGSTSFVSFHRDQKDFLAQRIKTIGSVFVRRVRIQINLGSHINLKFLFRLAPEISPLPLENPVNLGNLVYQAGQKLLFEFLVEPIPAGVNEIRLGDFLVAGLTSGDDLEKQVHISFVRPVLDEPVVAESPAEIIDALSRLRLYRLYEKARLELKGGNVELATRHLQFLATHLIAQGENKLAQAVLSEVNHVQKGQAISREGDKRIKYGTRALLLPATVEGGNS